MTYRTKMAKAALLGLAASLALATKELYRRIAAAPVEIRAG